MKQIVSKNRAQLKHKMAEALYDNIKSLSAGVQDILIDDLATAFENRLIALNEAELKLQYYSNIGVEVPNATI